MMPDDLSGNFAQWQSDLYQQFINNPNYVEFKDFNIIIGAFIE